MSRGPGAAQNYVLSYLDCERRRLRFESRVSDIAAARAAGLSPEAAVRNTRTPPRAPAAGYESIRRAANRLAQAHRIELLKASGELIAAWTDRPDDLVAYVRLHHRDLAWAEVDPDLRARLEQRLRGRNVSLFKAGGTWVRPPARLLVDDEQTQAW